MSMMHVTPEFPVKNVAEAQAYYRDILDFEINWIWEDNFGAVGSGHIEIFFFEQADPIHPAHCYIFVEDANDWYDRLKQNGATIIDEIDSKPWGMREFVIKDLNGHTLRIGHSEQNVDELDEFSRA